MTRRDASSDPRPRNSGRAERSDPSERDAGLEAIIEGSRAERAPVLVVVHGVTRHFEAQADAWRSFAESREMLLVAPHFEAERYDDYQRLGRTGRGRRADLALIDLVDRLADEGRAGDRIHLVGYSGGAQLAHRFALAWPSRVRALVSVASGWYTFPDRAHTYPYGVRASSRLPGVRFDLQGAAAVPTLVAVGERDDERDGLLRVSRRVERQQGPHRIARARAWVEAMNAVREARDLAGRARLEILPGAGHSFTQCMAAGLAERVGSFFDELGVGADARREVA